MRQKKKINCEYDSVEKSEKNYGFGIRHVQVLLVFTCLSVAYIMRANMSVAIVAMTDKTHANKEIEIFDWNKQTKDIILSSFFWGYMIMQIPVGQLAESYGAKPLLVVAMLVNGAICIIFPWAVHLGGWKAACACRTLQGLTQSCFYPCISTLASRWIPNHERSRLTNFLYAGSPFGTILGMPLASVLSSTNFGWPSMFYCVGGLGLVGGIIWIIYGASTPSTHSTISEEERIFITKNLGHSDESKNKKMPWRGMLTSVPFYAVLAAHIGSSFGFTMLLVEIPSYMNQVLGINMKESGLLSALPYTAMWIGGISLSFVSDYIVNNKICSKTVARKIFNSIGSWTSAILLVVLCFIPPGHSYIVVGILTCTVGISSSMNMGFMMSFIDIAPNYAGSFMGVTNCAGQVFAILAPMNVGYLVTDESDPKQWHMVFYITAAVYFVANLVFIIYGTSKIQPWNDLGSPEDVEMPDMDDKNELKEKESFLTKNENQRIILPLKIQDEKLDIPS